MTWLVLSSEHAEAATQTPGLPSAIYCALVAVSRVHEGLHFPSDVIIGSLAGFLSASLYARFLFPALPAIGAWPAAARLFTLAIPGAAAALTLQESYTSAQLSLGKDPPEWRRNACRGRYAKRELDPRGTPYGNYIGMLGVLAGLAIGGAFKHHIPLPYPTSNCAALLRALIGNAGLLAMFEGITAATPRRPLRLYAALRFIRYLLVPVYILLLAPAMFRRLRL
jgi:uncharacterized membrane protein YeaQ/YmgE (transglycosylase-associated protein family)